MKRAIRLVFTDETDWATFLEAMRKMRADALDEAPIEACHAYAVSLLCREYLDRPRPEAQSNGPHQASTSTAGNR
jgi:hypothetical protein